MLQISTCNKMVFYVLEKLVFLLLKNLRLFHLPTPSFLTMKIECFSDFIHPHYLLENDLFSLKFYTVKEILWGKKNWEALLKILFEAYFFFSLFLFIYFLKVIILKKKYVAFVSNNDQVVFLLIQVMLLDVWGEWLSVQRN